MAVLVAVHKNDGVPVTGLSPLPTIEVFDADTPAVAVASGNMYEIGGGGYGFVFNPTDGINYFWVSDGGTGVTDTGERAVHDVISGTTVARLEVDVPAVLEDTGTTIPALIAAAPAAVWAVDLTGFDSALTSSGDMLNACRQFVTNRLDAAAGAPGSLSWYQDDGTTVRFTMTLRDFSGAGVSGIIGVPALRGAVV